MKRGAIRLGLGCGLILYAGSFGASEFFLESWLRQSAGHPDIIARGPVLAGWVFTKALVVCSLLATALGIYLNREGQSRTRLILMPFGVAGCLLGAISMGAESILLLPLVAIYQLAGGVGLWISYAGLFLGGVLLLRTKPN